MAKFCSEECKYVGSVCEACMHHNFEKKWCTFFDEQRDPYERLDCKEFICFNTDGEHDELS